MEIEVVNNMSNHYISIESIALLTHKRVITKSTK